MEEEEYVIGKTRAVKDPERFYGGRVWKLYCPTDFSGTILPTCDLLIPTGLDVSDIEQEYLIHSFAGHTYPSDDPSIERKTGDKLLIMSPWIHDHELYIHIINLGNTELKISPEKVIGYICFSKMESFNISLEFV